MLIGDGKLLEFVIQRGIAYKVHFQSRNGAEKKDYEQKALSYEKTGKQKRPWHWKLVLRY